MYQDEKELKWGSWFASKHEALRLKKLEAETEIREAGFAPDVVRESWCEQLKYQTTRKPQHYDRPFLTLFLAANRGRSARKVVAGLISQRKHLDRSKKELVNVLQKLNPLAPRRANEQHSIQDTAKLHEKKIELEDEVAQQEQQLNRQLAKYAQMGPSHPTALAVKMFDTQYGHQLISMDNIRTALFRKIIAYKFEMEKLGRLARISRQRECSSDQLGVTSFTHFFHRCV